MDVTIIGTGNMARGIGTRALAGGHNVTLIGHEAGKAESLAAELQRASETGAKARAAAEGAALEDTVVILAVWNYQLEQVVEEYGAQLAGKIVVDITNPVDFNTMGLTVAPGTSQAEELARRLPAGTKVLKAFNTTFAGTLVAGQVGGQPLDVLIAGDDAEAKATLGRVVESAGLRAVDVGPLQRAQLLEALGLLHMVVQPALNTGYGSTIKILA